MSRLSLALLGPFYSTVGDTPITAFRTDKVRALLAYLALEPEQPHSRHALAGLLWPDLSERQSLDNVRVTLYRLRQTLDAAQPGLSDRVLTIARQSVQLNSAAVRVDVAIFEAVAGTAVTYLHNQLHNNASLLAQLAQAMALYRGELLAGFSLPDAPIYEEWLLLRREQLAVRALSALKMLADAYETQGDFEQAHTYATRMVELDPYGETGRRQLMRILAHRGLPDQAVAQYTTLRKLLRNELGVEPNAQSVALYEQIRTGEFVAQTHPHHDQTFSAALSSPNSSEIPFIGFFTGRVGELACLEQWLIRDGCRLVAVLGLGGVGKTSLVAHTAGMVAGHFERVLWRSLLNAPPLDNLLVGLLRSLAEQPLVEPPKTLDEQLDLLIAYLRRQRVLLVLDNLESILNLAQTGHGAYEVYNQLLQRVATSEHHSTLVLTSRERPAGINWLHGETSRVRMLILEGLDEAEGRTLLTERGVAGSSNAQASLVARYSGNPLALKLVADTVQELFAGDVESFLAQNTIIFDDVRKVLREQVDRLTELERSILFWLAVEREAVDIQTLRHNLVHPPGYAFLESLRNLQNRSLLERQGDGFALQNVIVEYMTERLVATLCAEIEAEQPDLFHRHALLKAEARDYMRQSQARLILAPIAEQLQGTWGKRALEEKLQRLLTRLRQVDRGRPSYAAGNLLNLLLHLEIDVTGYDFSQLSVWQADLRGASLAAVNLADADLSHSVFSESFGQIFALALHPNGELLAAGDTRGDLRLWSFPEGQNIGLLTGHTNSAMCIAFSPDGKLLASGSLDRTIRIWYWQTGQCLKVLTGHDSSVLALAFTADSKLLISGSQDHTVRLWDVHTGEQIELLTQHTDAVIALALHPIDNILASGSDDHSICLWDLSSVYPANLAQDPSVSARLIETLHEFSSGVRALAFSPDGSLLAGSGVDTTIRLWKWIDRSVVATLYGHSNVVRCLVFSSDGARLFSSGADRTIRMWDVANQLTLQVLNGHEHVVRALVAHRDGSFLASGGLDDTIRLWDLRRHQTDPAIRTIHGHLAAIHSLAFSYDGTLLAVGDGKGWLRLWSMDMQQGTSSIPHMLPGRGTQINSIAFSRDSRWLASADYDRLVRVWDLSSRQTVGILHGHMGAVHSVRFSPQGNMIASSGTEGLIYVWDSTVPSNIRLHKILKGHTQTINSLQFTADGTHLISCAADSTLRVWDLAAGVCVQVIKEENEDFITLTLSPDNSLLAAAGWHRVIRIYRVDSQKQIQPYQIIQTNSAIFSVAFNPDGSRLAIGGEGGIIWVQDVQSGQEHFRLPEQTQSVRSVAFHPNGKLLAIGSDDETVRLWAVDGSQPPDDCVRMLRVPGPYEGMNIAGVTGISDAQRSALMMLGARPYS